LLDGGSSMPYAETAAVRPLSVYMANSNTKVSTALGVRLPHWTMGVQECGKRPLK